MSANSLLIASSLYLYWNQDKIKNILNHIFAEELSNKTESSNELYHKNMLDDTEFHPCITNTIDVNDF